MDRESVEALIREKIEANEAETGLYDTGLQYVVVDRVGDGSNDTFTFTWFENLRMVDDLLIA